MNPSLIPKRTTNDRLAQSIAERIADDIQGRCGLGNEWEQIDSETQREILENWAEIVREELSR